MSRAGTRSSISGGAGADFKPDSDAGAAVVDAEGFNEKVFLTSINDPGTLSTEIHEPEAFTRVKQIHGQIGGVVQTLNEKIAKVLQKQEKEFLAAYRAHMYQVQKELQALKARANDAEMQLKRNDKLKTLEEEKEWYRKEALRLDKFATQLKSEAKFMKEKLDAVEEDRNWLEKQLKQSKKSGKIMRAELEVLKTSASVGSGDGARVGAQLALTGDMGSPASEYRQYQYEGGPGAEGEDGGEGGFLPPPVRPSSQQGRVWAGATGGRGAGTTAAARPPAAPIAQTDHNLTSALAMVERLQKELAAERQTVKALRAANVASLSDRTELEAFFLQCVEEVRKDISRRRTRAIVTGEAKGRPGNKRGELPTAAPPPVVEEHGAFDRGFTVDRVKAKAKEPGLSEFTATDRRRVVDRLLSDDYVLEALHHVIFSTPAADATSPQADGSSSPQAVGVKVPGVMSARSDDSGLRPEFTGGAGGGDGRFSTSMLRAK